VLWSMILFVVALILHRKNLLTDARLWLILLLLSIGNFAISFWRGDFSVMLYSLRSEQWLDIGLMLFAGILLVRSGFIVKTGES